MIYDDRVRISGILLIYAVAAAQRSRYRVISDWNQNKNDGRVPSDILFKRTHNHGRKKRTAEERRRNG